MITLKEQLQDALTDAKHECNVLGHDFDIADALAAIWPVVAKYEHIYDNEYTKKRI